MSTINVNRMVDSHGGVLAPISSVMRNRIINGAMTISQRNGTSSVTIGAGANTYTLDRWFGFGSQASRFSIQQNAGAVTPPAGFINYLGVTSLSAYSVGSSEQFIIAQAIEGFNTADLNWGTANAKTVTVSFLVRSSLTGAFGGSLRNATINRSYPFTYTINSANTWEQKSITIAGDTIGTWVTNNGVGIYLTFGLGVGSTLSGTAGTWAGSNFASATGATSVVTTNGATFYITGVQLEVGTQATGFEYRHYQQELSLCQRYYYRIISTGSAKPLTVGGQCYSTIGAINPIPFPVTMRTAPTALEQSGTAGDYRLLNAGTSLLTCTAVPAINSTFTTQYTGCVEGTVASGLVAGNTTTMTGANANAYLGWSAEL